MRDVLVTCLRSAETGRNALNEPVTEWQELGQVYARKTDLSDEEMVAAGQESSARVARFRVRENAMTRGLTGGDRLQVAGEAWDIRGVVDAGRRRRAAREITAVRRSDRPAGEEA